jgi:hypothetical protein
MEKRECICRHEVFPKETSFHLRTRTVQQLFPPLTHAATCWQNQRACAPFQSAYLYNPRSSILSGWQSLRLSVARFTRRCPDSRILTFNSKICCSHVPFWSPWGMTRSPPHLVKRADRAAISLYLTLEHVSQGGVQIRGSSRCHYMRYSSQNPKTALWSTLLDLPIRNIWIIKVIHFFISHEIYSLGGPWNTPYHLIPKQETFMGACRCAAKSHIRHPYQPNPNPKLDP